MNNAFHALTIMGLVLGAVQAAYISLKPGPIGMPFPNLQGELTVFPTRRRIVMFLIGRWVGNIVIGILISWVALMSFSAWVDRMIFGLVILGSIFILLFLAVEHSPDILLARSTDPSRLPIGTWLLGFLSAGTLIAPTMISILLAFVMHSWFGALLFLTNVSIGFALVSLPTLKNFEIIKKKLYQDSLRLFIFLCALCVLVLSIINFINI